MKYRLKKKGFQHQHTTYKHYHMVKHKLGIVARQPDVDMYMDLL